MASRISVNYLMGYYGYDESLFEGITDITARLGGTCPAIMTAVAEFDKNPSLSNVIASVDLNYNPSKIPAKRDEKIYLDDPKLRITSRINRTMENVPLY